MARPTKSKIDYFPIDCTGDDRMKLVELKHGLVAYAVYVKLLQKIYGNKGYYTDWNEDSVLLFSGEYAVDYKTVSDIVSDMLRRGIFDTEKYEKYSILTSRDIQEQYFFVIAKRRVKVLDERYCLINQPETGVIAEKTGVIATKTEVSVNNNTHSIGEYSKVKDSISEESIGERTTDAEEKKTPTHDKAYGEFKNVILSDNEYEELSKRYGDINKSIERLSQYMAATGKGYASHYAVLSKWAQEDLSSAQSKSSPSVRSKEDDEYDRFVALAIKRGQDLIQSCVSAPDK